MRGEWLTPINVRVYGKDRWVTLDWVGYATYIRGVREEIWIPPGYVTDLASIPQLVQFVLPSDGPYRAAAVPHDWLFDTQDQHDYSFLEVNEIMLEGMKTRAPRFYIEKVPGWQRVLIKTGIDAGAWVPWGRNISHRFRDTGLLNPEPGGPRADITPTTHAYSGRSEADVREQGKPDGPGITTPRVP